MNPVSNRFESLFRELFRPGEGTSTGPARDVTQDVSQLPQLATLLRPNGEPVPQHWTQFHIDEVVTIKNYTFRVAYIGETAILFEPVGPVIISK
jgi:hypothetical protein